MDASGRLLSHFASSFFSLFFSMQCLFRCSSYLSKSVIYKTHANSGPKLFIKMMIIKDY